VKTQKRENQQIREIGKCKTAIAVNQDWDQEAKDQPILKRQIEFGVWMVRRQGENDEKRGA
jgi:hypothetical protein